MVRAAEVTNQDTVVEIGPGTGVLTQKLLDTGAHVIAIEKDADLIPLLTTLFTQEISEKRFELIHGDIRTFSAESQAHGAPYKVVANIPYYITGEIIRDAFEAKHQPLSITLLVQKEVAERIARSKKESILSLSVKVYGEPRYIKTVPRGAFSPPPNVDSAIIHISSISRQRFDSVNEQHFFSVVKCAFKARRKMLAGNLRSLFTDETIQASLDIVGISRTARAEDIPLNQWVQLVKALTTTTDSR